MSQSISISENELLDALREAAHQAIESEYPDAQTGPELARKMGISETQARARIRPLVMSGILECVRVRRVSMAGVPTAVPAYRVVAPKKKGKK